MLMDWQRLTYYLAQIGCADERISARRSPNEHCDEALSAVGFSPHQIAQVNQARLRQRAQVIGESAIIVSVNAVAASLNIHRFEKSISGLSHILSNWDNIVLAYSVADTIGWDTTAELVVATAEGAIPFGVFLFTHSEEIQSLADALGYGAECAALTADLAEALTTMGLSIVLSAAAFCVVKWMNSEPKKRLEEAEKRTKPVQKLHVLLASGALPQEIRRQLSVVPEVVAAV